MKTSLLIKAEKCVFKKHKNMFETGVVRANDS